jgi:C4-dicarboxylate-specific signal transduction histidine kinase
MTGVLDSTESRWKLTHSPNGLVATIMRYALPFVLVAVAVAFSLAFDMGRLESPLIFLFFLAVIASAWFGDAVSGWIAVALATMAVNYFVVAPVHALSLDQNDFLWPAGFAACAMASNTLSVRRRHVEYALRQARDELDVRVQERTAELATAYENLRVESAERLQAEAARRKTQRDLARVGRILTMGELTASIAHEINQPLAAVVTNGNASLNWLRREPPAYDEVKRSVEAMIAAAERASEVIRDVRDLIKKGASTPVRTSVNEIISDVLALVQEEIRNRDAELCLLLDPALPMVCADPVELRQIVLNLVMNALDAMDDLRNRRRELIVRTYSEGREKVVITVEDSGHGFSESNIDHLFQSFYSTKPNGIGMGLSISRSIVKTLGGRIVATPRVPHGAMFSVILPAGRAVHA